MGETENKPAEKNSFVPKEEELDALIAISTLESNQPLPSNKKHPTRQRISRTTKLENTLLCIQVEQAIFGASDNDEFTVQATNNKEEIKQLLSVGFEYVCQKDDLLFFRKRKIGTNA